MFMSLGHIVFEVLHSPESLESSRTYDYAEHKIVQGKGVLQWIGDGLEELKFELMLHTAFINPAAALLALRTAGSAHQALSLLYGNGYHRGKFVITEIDVTYKQMSAVGDLIYVTANVSLKEWLPDTTPLEPAKPQIAIGQQSFGIGNDRAQGQPQLQLPSNLGLSPLLVIPPDPPRLNLFYETPPSVAVRSE